MKLELTIKRPGGTPVPIGDKNYEFKPESSAPDAPHVCEVEDESHIAILLGTGVYRLAGKIEKKPPLPAPTSAPAASDPLAGMDDAKVRAWAKENKLSVQGIGVLKGAKLREKVLAAFNAKA